MQSWLIDIVDGKKMQKLFWKRWEDRIVKKWLKQGYRVDIADHYEINPILHCVFGWQCPVLGLILEVRAISLVIGIVNPIPYTFVPVTFCNLILSFFPKGFCNCVTGTEAILKAKQEIVTIITENKVAWKRREDLWRMWKLLHGMRKQRKSKKIY